MLDIRCEQDGISRRSLLKVGALGVGGLALPELLRQREVAAAEGKPAARKKSVILVWLAGGPSHIDMYDLKPDAPAEIRGEFKPIRTNVAGIQIGEHLPMQAAMMDKFSIVRSAYHTNAGHGMGSQWMMTGWQPTIEVNDNIFPSTGSIVARMKGPNKPGMPAYVNLPRQVSMGKAAYLGASYNPFSPDADPNAAQFKVRNLKLPGAVDEARMSKRRSLLSRLDTLRRDVDLQGDIEGLDTFYRDAVDMVLGEQALKAFDIGAEDAKLRDDYGRNDLGQSCLLARRLVEAGVTYVAVQAGGGWDTHSDNFSGLKNKLLPNYDRAVATLIRDLATRGLDRDVLVVSFGEFGRTPKINGTRGRDHWPGAMSVLYAGGGLQMGKVVGATDSKAEMPSDRPYTPGSVLATVYHTMGIDHEHVFYDHSRRPMAILNEGEPIRELIG